MDGMQNDLSQKIDNLQYSISRLTNLNTVQEKGRFPSQPHQNPKGVHEVENHEGESSQVRDVKALITLRSGKKVELPTPKPQVEEEEEEETKKREEIKGKKEDISERKEDHDSILNANPEKMLIKEEMLKKHISPPFPQALHGKRGLEMHQRFLKGLNVNKKAFLTEQVSAIIQCKSPLKYKDPGCPTISVMIGGKVVEKALLDLGASVNLLSYSVYKQLGLGELKPTSITLSLADRSVKIPRGQITPEEEEGPEEVCIIDTLVEEHCNQNMQDKLNESLGDLEEGLPEPSDVLALYKSQEKCLLEVLTRCKKAIGWQISDLKGISPLVVRVEVLKLLQAGIIYPISDSPWVSPTQVVPKKSGITVVQNEKGEENHYTPHFKLEGEDYFHMSFGTYAYRRMPFGLCNAPATLQRCMLSIFSDMVEQIMGGFMDDITIYGGIVLGHIISEKGIEVEKQSDFAIGAVLGQKRRWKALWSFIIVFTDHSALKYLLTKQDAKARLIRWILLLQEFDLQIKDKKGVENVVADHLQVTGEVPSEWKAQDRKHFFAKIHAYYWEEPFLFKYCADQIIRKCVPEEEQQGILSHCHESACGGHFASQKTAMKVLQSGFTWSSLFKDATSSAGAVIDAKGLGS
ncbi:hypothetical protein CK203_039108 [Vitis vinifera]|uniref:RNA-directed DNA polymerase n=1 Tax=Vitis vinifera TaxID=29760 RepID=A0A438IFQ1_VITVI|nr:hypothetical protein CK203_039108 [Vitis vinifera]